MLCVVACVVAQTPDAHPATLAVVPVQVHAGGVSAGEASHLLTRALTDQLSTLGAWRVLSPDDVSALLEHHGMMQATGCEDGSCVAELANALGARIVATGTLTSAGSQLLWTVSLLDAVDGTLLGRAAIQACSLQALLSQSRELVLQLLGRGDEAALTGDAARRRFGFFRTQDLALFNAHRAAHKELTTSEALTSFILEHNFESPGLAVGEALVFGGATVLLTGAMMGFFGAYAALTVQANAVAAAALAGGGACLAAALVAGLCGVGLVLLDALDLGRIPVSRKGCCRQDSDLHDAAGRTAIHRTAALSIALNGPVSILAVLLLTSLLSAFSSVVTAVGAPAMGNPSNLLSVPVAMGYLGSFCCFSWIPVCVGCPLALVLLLKPDRELLDDASP